MSSELEESGVDIVGFSTEWMDSYLDLEESNGYKDPSSIWHSPREERKARILRQISAGIIRAHFVAMHEGKIVGLARAIMPPTCGEIEERAILVLTVSRECKDLGIESELLNRICEDLHSQNVKWIEMAILDSWSDWQRFLEENGFEPREKNSRLVLRHNVPVQEAISEVDVIVRPVQLPEDRGSLIGLFRRERIEDMPKECDIEPPWWEMEPLASILDPEGFLVAEDRETGEIVGFIDSWFKEDDSIHADIGTIEVAKKFIGTRLRERLLSLAIIWLREKGAVDIRGGVHVGYRNEEDVFERLGFEVEYKATNWRKSTHS